MNCRMRACETFRCMELNICDSFFPFWSGGNTTGKEKGDLVKYRTRLMTNKLINLLVGESLSMGCFHQDAFDYVGLLIVRNCMHL